MLLGNPLPPSRTLLKPAVALLLLSPITGELLSASSPPIAFFTPFSLFMLIGLYGCGALLVREYARRWGRGWVSIVLLGAAYGIIEEGLTAKSFFDPTWMDLGILGLYGRWLDVNWVWSQGLTIYHAIVSITVPIILIQLTFPASSGTRWLGRKAFFAAHAWFIAVVVLGFALITNFYPNVVQVIGIIMAVFIVAYAAKNRPPMMGRLTASTVGTKRFYVLSLLMMVTFFPLIFWVGPYVVPYPLILFLIGIVACALYGKVYSRWGSKYMSESQLLGIAGGVLTPWMILTPLQETGISNPDSTAGMTFVGIIYAIYIIILAVTVRRRRVRSMVTGAAAKPYRVMTLSMNASSSFNRRLSRPVIPLPQSSPMDSPS